MGRLLDDDASAAPVAGLTDPAAFVDDRRLVSASAGALVTLTPGEAPVSRTLGALAVVGAVGVGDTLVVSAYSGLIGGGVDEDGEPIPPTIDVDVFRVDAAATTLLASGAGSDSVVGIADDGTAFFLSDRDGSTQVWSVGVDGGEPAPVTTAATIFGRPAVSADGTLLCWEDAAAGVLVLADVVDGVAGEPRRLGDGVVGSDPAFAADGRVVFRRFLEVDDAVAELFVFDPADTGVVQLTSDGAIASAPALAR